MVVPLLEGAADELGDTVASSVFPGEVDKPVEVLVVTCASSVVPGEVDTPDVLVVTWDLVEVELVDAAAPIVVKMEGFTNSKERSQYQPAQGS
jgi:hypothetical protein